MSDDSWRGLDGDRKRARLLDAAEDVFSHYGFESPMPDVARAAGVGVGSLYRQFASKEALIAALAERRLEFLARRLDHYGNAPDAWAGIVGFVGEVLGDDASDPVSARAVVATDAAHVAPIRARVHVQMQSLVRRAIDSAQMRSDATFRDVIMVVRGSRAVRNMGDDAWRRCMTVMLDGLRAQRPTD